MRRSLNLIAIVSLLSGCGIPTVSSVSNSLQNEAVSPSPEATPMQALEFQDVTSGRAETEDGTPFSFHLYKSADGRSISTKAEMRGSPGKADREFQKILKSAKAVVEQGPKLDTTGRSIGRRAVLDLTRRPSSKTHIMLVWTHAEQLYIIEADSVQDALEFEKRYRDK